MVEKPRLTEASPRRHGSSAGQPVRRLDGVLKVTGAAVYAADNNPPGLLHAVMATSSIANGRVIALDVAAAKRHPGVVEVMTPENRPPIVDPARPGVSFGWRMDVLQSDIVHYAKQPIAVVIATTLEAATEGAALLAPRYAEEPPIADFDAAETYTPTATGVFSTRREAVGDVETALEGATFRLDQTYDTPAQFHNPLEPHAIVAAWDGDKLTVDTPSQGLGPALSRISELFCIPPENIHIRSPFLGGGFGNKGFLAGPQVLGILAARLVGKPVKLVMRRDQMFGPLGHRGRTSQRLRLGLDSDNRLVALHHSVKAATSVFDEFVEPSAKISHALYGKPAILTDHEAVAMHIGTPGFMRAPGEASGSAALEVAIDEAAFAQGLDPLAFRLHNYAEVEPISGKPFSSKELRACYAQGAARFGWAGRPIMPGQMRDASGFRLGWGVGTATFPTLMFGAEAKAILLADGTAKVEIAAADMGQGAWTALAQIGADSLGLAIDQVELRAGDSSFPNAGVAGGSAHTATAGSAIHVAGTDVIVKLAQIATCDRQSPLYGAGNAEIVAGDGTLFVRDDDSRRETFSAILGRAGLAEIRSSSQVGPDSSTQSKYAMHAHGAVFAEVRVDPDLGQVRVTRLVGAFAAGSIINPHLVRSQYLGGMIWGLAFALHEEALLDHRSGRILNTDLASYHVPVNADVMSLETLIVEETDPHVNPLGVKGVGELSITGTVGAIANAIWHATGIRVRRYPIRISDLIS
ncbi:MULTISPECIES: xanthine dehydrogenase family protein molybdopterin-binding subunit [unclassified Mesorhizobium]|uniref:xanthine dehydrogenase family protein molybdopterin-binding subunit n=1 Tax=unclassified Mesorhizobium TaxID=325217 RepID=UPI000FD71F2E|nr:MULTISPECIES: xanthine dehydrogenase family protein molybdopterin-binding subunit [unclassified Mesorhizobium]TGR23038.1 xanthine dehydrogenase family protein molybdopterin-binding subunit [Mesorhizobium sp. M8A.F.Ca.ET.197.01.1.1]TGR39125.1 xanthine dehydrogenase family protein molybdopterin-binding subunit [bacterium M00.F.Ca.ET.199.01.1.1]TGR46718.1 xanthine dehydrogenase family protein molybdopterin-binding subunit [Mesorhizobium sp. M8A.F.Ca.ET.198.01.1.1]TGV85208.1 xanthine dehydrogena